MIKLALRRTFGAVLLSGAALALSTAAAMPAEAAATTVKVGCGSFGVTVPMGRPRSGRWCRSCVRLIAGLGVIGALVP